MTLTLITDSSLKKQEGNDDVFFTKTVRHCGCSDCYYTILFSPFLAYVSFPVKNEKKIRLLKNGSVNGKRVNDRMTPGDSR